MFLLSFNAFKHRSIFAAFLAIFLLFGAVKGTKAQESNGSAFDGLEKLDGISAEQMMTYASKGEHGKFPTDDKSRIFFLYNVKTGLLLNVGGYWGTHVSLQEYGMPLSVYKDKDNWIHFQQDIDKQGAASGNQEGCSLEYFYGEGYASTSIGVFVDRDIYPSKDDKTLIIQRGWTIEPISGDAQNTFRIFTYRRSTSGYTGNNYDKYYLSAAASQGDVDKNCGAFLKTDNDYSDKGSQWRIFSYEQLYNLQTNSIGFKSSLDLSFKLECPGFNRDNGALEKWKTAVYKEGTTGLFRFGLEKHYKTDPSHGSNQYKGSVSSDNPYTFNKTQYKSMNDYQTHLGKYYCADIKNTRGAVYQVVHVDNGGSYVIECKAYSNTNKAKLFAVLLQDKSEKPTDYTKIVEGSLRETVVMQTANMSQTEQDNLHVSDQNMDYAGKEFYGSHKYFNSVLVQVPEGGGNICFGVRVGSVAENENVAKDGEWTVFDDFRLLYAGSTTSRDLILDEDKDNLNYLLDCTETYDDVVLHLNKKSFNNNINKWNTIVLPVDLNKDQFTQAFGANARLARLKTLTQKEIQFETVKIAQMRNDDVVLQAYVPYIIYPTKDLSGENTPAYTAHLTKVGQGEESTPHKVTIAGGHIDIPNVSLKRNKNNENDLSGLDRSTWMLNLNKVDIATKPGDSEIVTDGTLAAYGTFARTFGDIMKNDEQTTFTVDKKNPIIEGRDNLKGCYFFHEGKMVYAGNKVRGLRGFSVWFKPYKQTSGAASSKFILDGIDYTTDVERIMATEDSSIDSKFAKLGVFNLNGQLVRSGSTDVSGLPSGIYIVNGKKVFVK
ncbi:hypothetical protein [Segatella hominis]|uniref:hypothetical protein n=1 Tax=Segatella hominis TaxID=2518605 RepID=UPI003AB935F9